MSEFHLTEQFSTEADTVIFEQCDRLMEALVDLEDPLVHSASVSADAGQGLVLVEVYAEGVDLDEAERVGRQRIREALQSVGIRSSQAADHRTLYDDVTTTERNVELVPA